MRIGWLLSTDREDFRSINDKLVQYDINMIIPNVNDDIWKNLNLIKKLRNRGYLLCAWGAKDLEDVKKMHKLGINGMTVDWPGKASKAIL